jgi:ABC-2 type transport system ATP-binding protein
MSSNAIKIKNLTKTFVIKRGIRKALQKNKIKFENQQLKALDEVSFSVDKGQVLGIIGLNGSGKSTLLKTISGIYKPDLGTIEINGTMAPILQIGSGLQPQLSLHENIIIFGMLLGLTKSEIQNKVTEILDFADLTKFAETKLKHLSSGMKMRLAFSTTLQIKADIILLDEVLAVGDALFKKKCNNVFNSFKKEGKTILFTTHNLNSLTELCDNVLFLHKGKSIMIGTPEEVINKFKEIVKLDK